jgi:L-ascorbate peroxidase
MFKTSACVALALLAGAEAFVGPVSTFGNSKAVASATSHRSISLVANSRGGRTFLQLSMNAGVSAEKIQQLKDCKAALADLLDKTNANPLMVRLAWHDSGTYDKSISEWPRCGGAIGSIRFEPEITHGANAGKPNACCPCLSCLVMVTCYFHSGTIIHR